MICFKCQRDLNESCFAKNRTRKSGYSSQCKDCQKEYKDKHYTQKYNDYVNKVQSLRVRLKQDVDKYKSSVGCKFCLEKEACCLDFHHENKDKLSTVAKLRNRCSTNKMWEEIKKCIVVCANCHRKIHAGLLLGR